MKSKIEKTLEITPRFQSVTTTPQGQKQEQRNQQQLHVQNLQCPSHVMKRVFDKKASFGRQRLNAMMGNQKQQQRKQSCPLSPLHLHSPPRLSRPKCKSPFKMDRSKSVDTRKSIATDPCTPKAKSRTTLSRDNTDRHHNIGMSGRSTVHNTTQKYELRPSIHFLSLVLPSDYNNNCNITSNDPPPPSESSPLCHCFENSSPDACRKQIIPSITSMSDTTTATSATDVMSVTSGQTTLAKDRVQETIACSIEVKRYLDDLNVEPIHSDCHHHNKQSSKSNSDNSPTSVDGFQQCPVNVDFVLESNEMEIASFVNLFIRSKQYTEAIDIYMTVLTHFQKQFGLQYPLVITTLHNLGVVYVWKGDYNKALTYCQKALKLRKKTLGDTHPDVVTSLCELGIIYYAREDFNRGLDALREALHIACNNNNTKTDQDNPDYKVSGILNNIGCLHFSMGKLIASLATFEESLDMQRQLMGSVTSDDAAYMLLNMSITLCNAGIASAKHDHPEIASSLVEEGLMVQQSVLPDDHRFVKATSMTISILLGKGRDDGLLEVPLVKMEISLPRQLSNSSQLQVVNELLSKCSDMLMLGSVQNGGMNNQQRVSNAMQYKYLTFALLNEGYSKRACSWVTVGDKAKRSSQETSFNLAHVCEQAAQMIQVRLSLSLILLNGSSIPFILKSIHS